jgi:hypothetical protein
MPWVSKKQAAWGHSPEGEQALGGPSAVAEWDAATPKGSLPDKVRWPGALGRAKKKAAGSITHAG